MYIIIIFGKMRRSQTAMEYLMTYSWAILVILIVLVVLFRLGFMNPRSVVAARCSLPAGFSCASSKLYSSAYGWDLVLVLGQASGRTIKVTGIACSQNMTLSSNDQVYFTTRNWEKTMTSGSKTVVAGRVGENSGSRVICTGMNRLRKPIDTSVGAVFAGKIFINYTEMDTGVSRVIVGDFVARYEPCTNECQISILALISPLDNGYYYKERVPLNYSIEPTNTSLAYSLDGGSNVSLSGNISLYVSNGRHQLRVVESVSGITLAAVSFSYCLADVNMDRKIDMADVSQISTAYGRMCGDVDYKPELDLDEDCIVDIRDIALAAARIGKFC